MAISAICSLPCQNGGTCSAPDTCSCDTGWSGAICLTPDTPTLAYLRSLIAALPASVIYLPLSKQFGLNDASSNGHDGTYSSTKVDFVNGPTGLTETAIETGAWADQQFVTVGNYEPLEFQKNTGTSWTITLFTTLTGVAPIFEFDPVDNSDNTMLAHLWMYNSNDKLYFNPTATVGNIALMDDCTIFNSWNYVGVRFNQTEGNFSMLCDRTLFPGYNNEPMTSEKVLIGARNISGMEAGSDGSRYACFAVYREALTELEMQLVREQCSLWNQVVTCPTQCKEDKCWPDAAQTNGYRCDECNTGWSGADCDVGNFE